MRKLILCIALAALVALPVTALCRNIAGRASPAGAVSSESTGKVIRSSLGRGIASRTLTVGDEGFDRKVDPVGKASSLLPCYPNPFNPATTITYSSEADADLELAVYDVSGRLVRVLARHRGEAGELHQVVWDGTGSGGEQLPSGVYLLRLLTETSVDMRKLVLLK